MMLKQSLNFIFSAGFEKNPADGRVDVSSFLGVDCQNPEKNSGRNIVPLPGVSALDFTKMSTNSRRIGLLPHPVVQAEVMDFRTEGTLGLLYGQMYPEGNSLEKVFDGFKGKADFSSFLESTRIDEFLPSTVRSLIFWIFYTQLFCQQFINFFSNFLIFWNSPYFF